MSNVEPRSVGPSKEPGRHALAPWMIFLPPMPDADHENHCALCGAAIPQGAPFGQCPKCLLSLASGGGSLVALGVDLLDAGQVRSFGDYELLEEIARGGMGVVYRARQLSLGREVAVKMILAGELATAETVQRFRNEAAAAARLDHPNIVSVYEIGEHETQHYFSMRLVLGRQNIATWAKSLVLSPAECATRIAAMVAMVARAVAFAHERGVLHRDLKPSNILVDEKGEPQVTDFGLAKMVTEHDSALTHSAAMLGSPSYMAPEQADGRNGDVTTATDVYGLGAVLYELLAGRPPFIGATPLATAKLVVEEMPPPLADASRDLSTICLKCLAKESVQRYASALEVAEDLERFVRGEPIRARPVRTIEALWRWSRRRPKIAALLGALMLAFVLGFAGVTWQWRLAERARQGEVRALSKATATVVDLYTNTGLVAAKEEDTTRAALWFAQAAATPGADEASRAANRARWAAWRGDSTTAVRAFASGIGPVGSIAWRPSQDAIIVGPWRPPLDRASGGAWKNTVAAVWDLPNESRWLPQVAMTAAAWACHGECVVFADGKTVRLTEYPSGREVARVAREAAVLCFAVSEEDRWIAVGAPAPFLWDARAGKTVPLPTDAGAPTELEFSRDGQRLLITSVKLRGVCAVETPERFLFPPVENLGGAAQGFLGSGDLFIAHNLSNQLLVMKSDTGAVVETHPCASDPQSAVEGISPDGRFIARYSAGIIERPGGERSFPKHQNRFEALDFSRDGALLATASADDTVRLWHLPDGGDGRAVGWHQEGAYGVSISPDNRLVATAQSGGSLVRIWRVTEPPGGRAISGFPNSRIRLSRDGRLLIPSGRPDFNSHILRTRVFGVETGEPAGPEIVPGGEIMDAAFAPDGSWVALACSTTPNRHQERDTASGSGTVEFWDFRSGQRLGEPLILTAEPRALSVHPGGKKIAVYGARRTLLEVDVATRKVRQLFTNPPGDTAADGAHAACRYSPDGRMLLAWGIKSSPLVWDAEAEKFCTPPEWARSRVMDIDFHGGIAGSGSLESEMRFLALPGGELAAPRIQDTNWIFVTRFSAEGDLFLTGGRGRIGHVWDWRNGRLNCPALQHDGEIFGGAFLPGTECVATSGLDKVIRFWDRRTGLPVRAPLRQDGVILNLTVTADGRTLISDTKDGGDIRLYDIATLLPRPALPPDDALLLAEIDAAAEIQHGSLEPLSPAAWLEKWRQFRAKYPEWHRW